MRSDKSRKSLQQIADEVQNMRKNQSVRSSQIKKQLQPLDDKENVPVQSTKKKRSLIVDYSKKALTIDDLAQKKENSSKKRRLSEVTGNRHQTTKSVDKSNPQRSVLAEASNTVNQRVPSVP